MSDKETPQRILAKRLINLTQLEIGDSILILNNEELSTQFNVLLNVVNGKGDDFPSDGLYRIIVCCDFGKSANLPLWYDKLSKLLHPVGGLLAIEDSSHTIQEISEGVPVVLSMVGADQCGEVNYYYLMHNGNELNSDHLTGDEKLRLYFQLHLMRHNQYRQKVPAFKRG